MTRRGGDELRPDPDALLRTITSESSRSSRGRLKIFFGFAPGVGKTYAMLEDARQLVAAGVDLVIGEVVTHGRRETAALVDGLAVLPRRTLSHRGVTFDEFDLDAALARHPKLVLLDELAHTNVPGSRNEKRWQDVGELLAAGIDVTSTLNVQHLESLNDVIATITGVRVRETVPDRVLDDADEIILVDLPTETLLERLRTGRVYGADAARRATSAFFEHGNLLALRELALRRVAQRVDADVKAWFDTRTDANTPQVQEYVLAVVDADVRTDAAVRAAKRLADALRCGWAVASLEDAGLLGEAGAHGDRRDRLARLVSSLGGQLSRIPGERPGPAILEWARRRHVTHIVMTRLDTARSRRLRDAVLEAIQREKVPIVVDLVPPVETSGESAAVTPSTVTTSRWPAYGWSLAWAAATTAVAFPLHTWLQVPDVSMLFLLMVLFVGARLGRGPSVLASVVGVAAYDFLFVPPMFTFGVADLRFVLTFGMMFGVGLVTGTLASALRRQELLALEREEWNATLFRLSRDLGAATTRGGAYLASLRNAFATLGSPSAIFARDAETGRLERVETQGDWKLEPSDTHGVVEWCFHHHSPAGAGTSTLSGSRVTCAPLVSADGSVLGVLATSRPSSTGVTTEHVERIITFANQTAQALARIDAADAARSASVRAEQESLRSSLLASVSHDLRTPLAVITGAATTLRSASPKQLVESDGLLDSIVEQARRLERLMTNILDMTRLEAGTLEVRREWVPLDEIIGAATSALEAVMEGHRVNLEIAEGIPLLHVDPVTLTQLFVNLLENAAKYSPPRSTIEVFAYPTSRGVVVDVADHGPGFGGRDPESLFARFTRGETHGSEVPGMGLGLAICRAIATLHGGKITAHERGGGGAVFRLELPFSRIPAPEVPSSTQPTDAPTPPTDAERRSTT